jgi:hypothetical protein
MGRILRISQLQCSWVTGKNIEQLTVLSEPDDDDDEDSVAVVQRCQLLKMACRWQMTLLVISFSRM